MNRTLFLSIIIILKAVLTIAETEVEVAKEGSCRGKEQSRDGAQVTLDYDGPPTHTIVQGRGAGDPGL